MLLCKQGDITVVSVVMATLLNTRGQEEELLSVKDKDVVIITAGSYS